MFLLEEVGASIMAVMKKVHPRLRLSEGEREVESQLRAKLRVEPRVTRHPLVVCLIGLTGAGKSQVAELLAAELHATLISADDTRVALRKARPPQSFDRTALIVENLARSVIKTGGNAVIDSDFMDAKKRASLRASLRYQYEEAPTQVVYVRVVADLDTVIGRIMTSAPHELFAGAGTGWRGDMRPRVVKMRESMRHLIYHYRPLRKRGGTWALRRLSIKHEVVNIDHPAWEEKLLQFAKHLRENI